MSGNLRVDSIVVRLSWPVPKGANPEAWERSKVADRLLNGDFGIRRYYSYLPLWVEELDDAEGDQSGRFPLPGCPDPAECAKRGPCPFCEARNRTDPGRLPESGR